MAEAWHWLPLLVVAWVLVPFVPWGSWTWHRLYGLEDRCHDQQIPTPLISTLERSELLFMVMFVARALGGLAYIAWWKLRWKPRLERELVLRSLAPPPPRRNV